jgi:hypothetical protein
MMTFRLKAGRQQEFAYPQGDKGHPPTRAGEERFENTNHY